MFLLTGFMIVSILAAIVGATWRTGSDQPGPVMRAALAYERWSDRFAEVTGRISQYLVLATVVMGFINVLLRYGGRFTAQRLTNNGLIETQWYLYGLIFLVGFTYILKHEINVRVDFWFEHFSQRRKAWIDLIGHLIGLVPFCLIAIWISFGQVATSWQLNEQSPDPSGLPRAPIKTMILVAFAILLVQAVAEVIKRIAILRGLEGYIEVEEREAPIRIE